jgi:GAF domain-containing protein
MHADTLKKLQDIGAYVLASGCTKKSVKQVAEMIRAARGYRFIAIYKIMKNEFVILAGTGNEPVTYPRFPVSQGLCGAALESGKSIVVADVSKDKRYLPTFHTTRSEIIVPMRCENRHIVGMIDAESDKVKAFSEEDRQFLERAAGLIAHCVA